MPTPGPWEVYGDYQATDQRGDEYLYWAILSKPDGTEVARTKQGEDDARLIAAAPTMLEALEKLIDAEALPVGECEVLSHYNGGKCDWCVARAAIAQAKGH